MYAFSETVLPRPPDWGNHPPRDRLLFLDLAESWEPPEGLVDFLSSGPPR